MGPEAPGALAGSSGTGTPLHGSVLLPGELAPPEPAPKSRRADEIVAAARAILEHEGSDALTMRRLADELGIQAPSLYKHFAGKADVELAMIEDAFVEIGAALHHALHRLDGASPIASLLSAYRRHGLAHGNLYRLVTTGPLRREGLPSGLEEWAGNPFFAVTGDPQLAQALWSFAHGMVILELDSRLMPGSDLDATWEAGAASFEQAVKAPAA
jgi:AcrR family transcriptional regulator